MEPADSTEAEKLYRKADDFWRDVQYDSSNFYYAKASTIYEKFKSWKNFINCQKNMGINYRYMGNYSQAFTHLNNGLDAVSYLSENQDSLRAELYNSIGTIYYERGNYEKAYKYFKDMLSINEKLFGERHVNTGKSFQNVGLIYYRTGDYTTALQNFEKALSIWDSTLTKDNLFFANCYTNISNVYLLKEDFKKSIEYSEKALKIWIDKLGEGHPYIAMSYDNLANAYAYTGDYTSALEYDYKAMQIRRDLSGEESRDAALSYAGIGNIFVKMGNFSNAEYFLNKSVSIYRKNNPADAGLADAYTYTGDLLVKREEYTSAEAYYDSALSVIWPGYNLAITTPDDPDKIPREERILPILIGKGNAYFLESGKSGNEIKLQNALNVYTLASELIEKLKSALSSAEAEAMLIKRAYEVNKKGVLSALKLYDIKKDADYIEKAFRFSERNKAVLLAESLEKADAGQFGGLPDSLLNREEDLRADIILYQTKLVEAEASNDLDATGNSRKQLFESQREYDELQAYLEQTFPSYYKLKHPGEIASSVELMQLLPSNAAVVEYFTGDSSISIFTITKNSVDAVTVNCEPGFLNLVRKFRESLPKMNYINYLSSASELYSKLIDPIKSVLAGKQKLYIIPDYQLTYLPFEALLTKSQPQRFNGDFSHLPFLINEYEISYQYSARLLQKSLLNINNNSNKAFAGLTGNGDNTETEVDSIGELFKEHHYHCDHYLKNASTPATLRSDQMKQYKFIHLATPGFINDDHSKLSGLLLYPDNDDALNENILYAGDIYNLNLNADLLVLSDCESDPATIKNGEGIYAITGSFLYAGVNELVMSLWKTPGSSKGILLTLFYKSILNGMDYSSALRNAKLELIKGGVFAYPLEWASFAFIGR